MEARVCSKCCVEKLVSAFAKDRTLCKECCQVICPHCSEKMNSKVSLERHISVIHKGIKAYSCDRCGTSCSSKSNLRVHRCLENESDIQKAMQKKYNAGSVKCPAGIIDIITSDTIIEIKSYQAWKAALGQLLAYSVYYPTHKLQVHFYGAKVSNETFAVVKQVMSKYNIKITEESEKEIVITADKMVVDGSFIESPAVCCYVPGHCQYIFKAGKNKLQQCQKKPASGPTCYKHS